MSTDIGKGELLRSLPGLAKEIAKYREMILANLVMVGEIPAPTFGEKERIAFLMQRFSECGLHNCSVDEVGNGVGVIDGEEPERSILLVAHADTIFADTVDHTVTVATDAVTGPGVADNSLGVALLASLPTLLEGLGIRLKSDLILLGGVQSLGRGNLKGLRFFLANNPMPIQAGVCIEGVPLERLSYSSIGMLRGEVSCAVPVEYDWSRFGATSAIVTLNEIVTKILEIPLPRRPKTNIFMGSIAGGTSFNTIARNAVLRFEIRSESAEIAHHIWGQIDDIASEVSSQSGADVAVDIFARREPGGVHFRHPLATTAREIMRKLGLQPRTAPSTSELSAFIDRSIPAITVGITEGENLNEESESIKISTIATGVAQLLAIIRAIDGGHCHEH